MVKETYLHDKHVALGAKMVDFAGWHMPVQYSSIIEEHKTVRNAVGLFDVSHMGEVFVSGKDATAFLNKIFPKVFSGFEVSILTLPSETLFSTSWVVKPVKIFSSLI